ncbi:pyruvate, water dikinase regulatory protein [Enterococcus sp. RIT-PI-f]|uniref:pyruvate, water dikinase regulatory protein n=1 Tax=Enterococcus sp. RIT-PI-f TaxID=1690244 RepID=UPI0006B8F956|nr:pyruvate, water dikinase regulatory protein [Enterococcus sp. RIT-PI-f]KPG68820.1 phosphotransferase [Enterococcus sp. RIT-PI-f]
MKNIRLYLISDSVGETAQKLIAAVSAQFPTIDLSDIQLFPFIKDEDSLTEILKDALLEKAIVVTTLVNKHLVAYVETFAHRTGLKYVDLMSPLTHLIEASFGVPAVQEPGAIHRLNQAYFSRVAAMEFAVKYDDGKDPRGFLDADLVLLGVSRTSKTPLSLYLANRGYKTANLPLIPEVALPQEIAALDPKKMVGLTTSAEALAAIRRSRMLSLGLKEDTNYTSLERIKTELAYAEDWFQKLAIPMIDVSQRSIEESALWIEEDLKGNRYD